jgi:hypothetical protein
MYARRMIIEAVMYMHPKILIQKTRKAYSYSKPSCSSTTSLHNGKLLKSSSSLSQGSLPILYPPTGKCLLPIVSKLFEKLFLKRLLPLFEHNKLIHTHQFGFRLRHSTTPQD